MGREFDYHNRLQVKVKQATTVCLPVSNKLVSFFYTKCVHSIPIAPTILFYSSIDTNIYCSNFLMRKVKTLTLIALRKFSSCEAVKSKQVICF